MELRHLRYFIAVAEELHFTRAAERLHIGQPPLSQQIQALEEELGVQLFERTRRKVALTEAGQRFLLRARDIMQAAQQAKEEAKRVQRGEVGVLRIGFSTSVSLTPAFTRLVRDYRRTFPEVSLVLTDMSSSDQLQAIAQHQLDIGFMRSPISVADERVVVREVSRDPVLVALNQNHPLVDHASLSLRSLAQEAFVLCHTDADTGFSAEVRRLCLAAGFEQKMALEVRELTTVLGLVAAGVGIAVVPSTLASIQLPGLRYRPLSDSGVLVSLSLAYARGDDRPTVTQFIARLQSQRDEQAPA